jgi:hypothetical protein
LYSINQNEIADRWRKGTKGRDQTKSDRTGHGGSGLRDLNTRSFLFSVAEPSNHSI